MGSAQGLLLLLELRRLPLLLNPLLPPRLPLLLLLPVKLPLLLELLPLPLELLTHF